MPLLTISLSKRWKKLISHGSLAAIASQVSAAYARREIMPIDLDEMVQMAARCGRAEVIEFLWYSVDSKHRRFKYPCLLGLAARGGHRDTISWLMARGVESERLVLYSAIKTGDIDLVEWVWKHAPAPSGEYDDDLLLSSAAASGNIGMVLYLRSHRPTSHLGKYTLSSAAENGHEQMVEWLVHNAQLGPTEYALYRAVCCDQADMVDHLMNKYGVLPNVKTALVAVRRGNARIFHALVDHLACKGDRQAAIAAALRSSNKHIRRELGRMQLAL